jgi:hypothetical protein
VSATVFQNLSTKTRKETAKQLNFPTKTTFYGKNCMCINQPCPTKEPQNFYQKLKIVQPQRTAVYTG